MQRKKTSQVILIVPGQQQRPSLSLLSRGRQGIALKQLVSYFRQDRSRKEFPSVY